jgi:hypothetical protein
LHAFHELEGGIIRSTREDNKSDEEDVHQGTQEGPRRLKAVFKHLKKGLPSGHVK